MRFVAASTATRRRWRTITNSAPICTTGCTCFRWTFRGYANAAKIALLTRYFVQQHAHRMGRQIDRIPAAALEALTRLRLTRQHLRTAKHPGALGRPDLESSLNVAMPDLADKAALSQLHSRTWARQTGPNGTGSSAELQQAKSRRAGWRGGSLGAETDNAAITHEEVQHRAPVSLIFS